MRPHTRTQCQENGQGSQCIECRGSKSPPYVPTESCIKLTISKKDFGISNLKKELNNSFAPDPDALSFVVPKARISLMASNMSSVSSSASRRERAILLVELPAEVILKILGFLSYNDVSGLRMVSRRFNELCASVLNSTFQKLQSKMQQRLTTIKTKMPRRESARRNHPLAREQDIVETIHMRLTLLQMTFGKHIERKHICFFAGEILDEVFRILRYIKNTSNLGGAFKVTDELFDLSTMAMEYFKEHIEPTLPEITFFGAEFLKFAAPFPSPTKKRLQSGAYGGSVIESTCDRSSVTSSSSVSGNFDVWSSSASVVSGFSSNGNLEMVLDNSNHSTPTNGILKKRINKVKQGMKKFNEQLVDLRRNLKNSKAKIDSQTKQLNDYSQRLEEYDKKFEEHSKNYQTLLTELNKCKAELQFWRSKSIIDLRSGVTFPMMSANGLDQAVADFTQRFGTCKDHNDSFDHNKEENITVSCDSSHAKVHFLLEQSSNKYQSSSGNVPLTRSAVAENASVSPRHNLKSGPFPLNSQSPYGNHCHDNQTPANSTISRKRLRQSEEEWQKKSPRGNGVKNRGKKLKV